MSAGTWQGEIDQGITWNVVITWMDSLGTLVDLTGYTARLQLRSTDGMAA
jgi:hypothetical protein